MIELDIAFGALRLSAEGFKETLIALESTATEFHTEASVSADVRNTIEYLEECLRILRDTQRLIKNVNVIPFSKPL